MKAKDSRAQYDMAFSGVENSSDKGTIKLHEGVIATVVKNAACSIDGIVSLAGNSFTDSIADILGTKKRNDGAIKIDLVEDTASIEISVIAAYGKNIPKLALNVQTSIIEDVKKITGLTVTKVDVIVQGVEEIEEKNEVSKETDKE